MELWRSLGGVLGKFWGVLGSLGASWVCLRRDVNASGTAIRRLGDVLEPSWEVLGGSWDVLGRLWKLPGTILEAFLKDFRAHSTIYENSKKPRKTHGFSLIFEVLGGFWSSKNQKNR